MKYENLAAISRVVRTLLILTNRIYALPVLILFSALRQPFLIRNTKRKCHAVFQGRFKRPISFSQVYSGQAFDEPIERLPAKWLIKAVLQFTSKLQPAMRLSLRGDKPYMLSPLASIAQTIGKELRRHSAYAIITR